VGIHWRYFQIIYPGALALQRRLFRIKYQEEIQKTNEKYRIRNKERKSEDCAKLPDSLFPARSVMRAYSVFLISIGISNNEHSIPISPWRLFKARPPLNTEFAMKNNFLIPKGESGGFAIFYCRLPQSPF
jgi:hypothetical protein